MNILKKNDTEREQGIKNKTKVVSARKDTAMSVFFARARKAITANSAPASALKPKKDSVPQKTAGPCKEIKYQKGPIKHVSQDETANFKIVKKSLQPWPRRRIIRAAKAAAIMAIFLVGLFFGAYLIAEPWIGPFDRFTGIGNHVGSGIVLSVGQSATVQIPLGDNEKIASIETKDTDILAIGGTEITALGEFWTTITVTTSEIKIPQRPKKEIKLFGWDLSGAYDSIRTWMRDLLGMEEKQPERTELRVLNIYEILVVVVGYEKQRGSDITMTLGGKATDPTRITGEERTILHSDDPKIVKTYMLQNGGFGYEAIATGSTDIHSQVGFWKAVSEDVYDEYLEKYPQSAAYMEDGRKACAQTDVDYPYEGMIFVVQRQISYKVVAVQPPRTYGGGGGSGGGSGDDGSGAQTLLQMINAARIKEGLKPVSWSSGLASAAKIRVNEITEVMSHTRPNGEPFYTVSSLVYGENLAGGIASAQNVFDAWMNSAGHRANILNSRYRTVGYAYLNFGADYWHYWALLFGL